MASYHSTHGPRRGHCSRLAIQPVEVSTSVMVERHSKLQRLRSLRRIDASASARHAALIITAQQLHGAGTHWEKGDSAPYDDTARVALNARKSDIDE